MLVQYGLTISWAMINFPRSYVGSGSPFHPQVILAVLLGGLLSIPNVALILLRPGRPVTRWSISISQMLFSCLLIGISGGRIETHFHIFGSLAFIALYRDWRMLVPAVAIVVTDHIARGIYFPKTIYGVGSGTEWRFIEHSAWIAFEAVVLAAACVKGSREIREIASQQAALEETRVDIEKQVQDRTKELQASEERKSAILANAMDAIITIDRKGIITEFNPAAEQMFQYSSEEALEKDFIQLLIPQDGNEKNGAELQEILNIGRGQVINKRLELLAQRKGEIPFPIELSITPAFIHQEMMFTAYVRDLGERKRLEAELSHSQKIQTVGQLATGMAHEINTPNQYIGDNLRFLQESFEGISEAVQGMRTAGKLSESGELRDETLVESVERHYQAADLDFVIEEVPRAIEHALEGVDRVAKIVSAMKTFSHPGQVTQTTVNLNKVIESTVEVARNEWKYVATIDLQLDQALPSFQGYPGELGQVFLNMIINSIHAIQEKFGKELAGRMVIKTEVQGDHVVVSIADNGAGIPQSARQHIFEAFFTTKEVGIGSGQGLAISRSVIQDRHRGKISFVSIEGKGTTFVIKLPFQSKQQEAA